MGAAFSGSSLYRLVGAVEIVTSSVIIGFGIQTLVQFYGMGDNFQDKYDRIQYSAITAVVQGALTLLAAFVLIIGSKETPVQFGPSVDKEKGDDLNDSNSISSTEEAQIALANKTEIKRICRTLTFWLIFSIFSIAALLSVFLTSMTYCIQSDKDDNSSQSEGTSDSSGEENSTNSNNSQNTIINGRRQDNSPCYTEDKETVKLRSAIGAMYTYCLVNIFALIAFFFLMYSQLQRVKRRGRRAEKQSSKGDREVCIPPEQGTNGRMPE